MQDTYTRADMIKGQHVTHLLKCGGIKKRFYFFYNNVIFSAPHPLHYDSVNFCLK